MRFSVATLLMLVFSGCSRNSRPEVEVEQRVSTLESPSITEQQTPAITGQQTPETAAKPQFDTQLMLDTLREFVTGPEWSIAQSSSTWSTFTVPLDEMGPEAESVVWQKWTAVPTAITLKAHTVIRDEIAAAVDKARQSDGLDLIEREFECQGFCFVVTASNGKWEGTRFVRISFTRAD